MIGVDPSRILTNGVTDAGGNPGRAPAATRPSAPTSPASDPMKPLRHRHRHRSTTTHVLRRRRGFVAVAVSVMACTGCADDGGTDGAAAPERARSMLTSSPDGSTTAGAAPSMAATPVTSGDDDAAAAAFTRSLFDAVTGDRSGLHGRDRAERSGRLRRGVRCRPSGSVRADDRRHRGRHRLGVQAVHRHGDPAAGRAGPGRPRRVAGDVSARSAGLGVAADPGTADPPSERDPGLHRAAPRPRLRR